MEEVLCSTCASANPSGNRLCSNCGQVIPLPEDEGTPISCGLCGKLVAPGGVVSAYYDKYACKRCYSGLVNRRVLAYMLDGGLSWGIFAILCILIGAATESGPVSLGMEWEALPLWIPVTATTCATAALLTKDAWFEGRSLGKWIFGLRVVDRTTGRPISVGQSVRRTLPLVVVPLAPVVAGLQLTKGDSSRWGDGWARTKVVRA